MATVNKMGTLGSAGQVGRTDADHDPNFIRRSTQTNRLCRRFGSAAHVGCPDIKNIDECSCSCGVPCESPTQLHNKLVGICTNGTTI
jgi:hypothetical protein